MPTYTQLPGELDVTFNVGDEVNVAMNLGFNVTNYTLSSVIYVAGNSGFQGGGGGFVTTVGATAATPSITVSNASTGACVWSLTETQTASLSPGIAYRWYFRIVTPGNVTRTLLAGLCLPKAPGG